MQKINYPLGHSPTELARLDQQAVLLHDPFLDELATKASTCLEIGCGHGSNLPLLRQANPNIHYTGIDIDESAIRIATDRFNRDNHAEFYVSDARQLPCNQKYDLIFTKLVLWSIGPTWQNILIQAQKLLNPGGVFYALEPCNQLIQFYPPKPAVTYWMKQWDNTANSRGLNTYIGIEVASALIAADYHDVNTKFSPVIALGVNRDHYMNIIQNLMGFYLGPAAHHFNMNTNERTKIEKEFLSAEPGNFVMDGLVATWGKTL